MECERVLDLCLFSLPLSLLPAHLMDGQIRGNEQVETESREFHSLLERPFQDHKALGRSSFCAYG